MNPDAELFPDDRLFEQGKNQLRKGNYKKAYEIFAKLSGQQSDLPSLNLYLIWSKIKETPANRRTQIQLTQLGDLLNSIPLDERHSALYYHVKGSFYSLVGDLGRAKTNFKHALELDNHFLEARRELSVVREQIRSQAHFQIPSLSKVVGYVLGRKIWY